MELLMAFVGGMTGGLLSGPIRDRIRNPHRWKCPEPGCDFSVKANHERAIEITKGVHTHDGSN